MFVNQNMVKIMRQNYEYLARIFCRRIRRHWLWNYPWALEFVCEQHEGENTMFGCTGFSKMIRHSLVSTKLRRRALRVWGSWVILRGCAACNKTTHSTILSGNTHLSGVCTNTKTHKHIKRFTTDLYQKCMYYNWTAQETLNVLSNMKCTSLYASLPY